MKIVATYANRKSDPEIVELVDAWDEFSVDSNYEGWQESRQKALDSWGDDLLRWVTVDITVPMERIYAVLDPDLTVEVEITPVIVDSTTGITDQ